MLSRDTYTRGYVDQRRAAIDSQISAYKKLATAARRQAGDAKKLDPALAAFEPVFFNNMVLVLDSYFVHRARGIEGKDGNPLNEVRVLCSSMIENDGVMAAEKSIKLSPEASVLKHQVGDEIRLTAADFSRLSVAFFAEIERKYL